ARFGRLHLQFFRAFLSLNSQIIEFHLLTRALKREREKVRNHPNGEIGANVIGSFQRIIIQQIPKKDLVSNRESRSVSSSSQLCRNSPSSIRCRKPPSTPPRKIAGSSLMGSLTSDIICLD
ncbi:unnamed protein product, partial [Linum tenue]